MGQLSYVHLKLLGSSSTTQELCTKLLLHLASWMGLCNLWWDWESVPYHIFSLSWFGGSWDGILLSTWLTCLWWITSLKWSNVINFMQNITSMSWKYILNLPEKISQSTLRNFSLRCSSFLILYLLNLLIFFCWICWVCGFGRGGAGLGCDRERQYVYLLLYGI